MRVSCTPSASGPTYRIYRSDNDFVAQMRCLVPLLHADQYDVLIGSTDSEPNVVLTIGPLDEARDAAFRESVVQYLDK
jgi:hypothetical protein